MTVSEWELHDSFEISVRFGFLIGNFVACQ